MFDPPDKTTVNQIEYVPPKGAIGFAPELIQFILSGQKLTTYRFGSKYDYLKAGDLVKIQDSNDKKTKCIAKITQKSKLSFKELPLKINVHESYRDKEHQRSVLNGYYAFLGRSIRDDDQFIRFDFILQPQSEALGE